MPNLRPEMSPDHDLASEDAIAGVVIDTTQAWLVRAVIGLNLCPFAKAVHVKRQIRYSVSAARQPDQLLQDLASELQLLAAADPQQIDTTLLIHPFVLHDFYDYNDFLGRADAAVEQAGFTGILQIASFHPHYQFADSQPDAIDNYTNRSPYPILHLLREQGVERAVTAFPLAADIYENNIATLKKLGLAGWQRLFDMPEI